MVDDAALHARLHAGQRSLMGRLAPRRPAFLERLQASVHRGYTFPWRIAECPAVVPETLFRRDLVAMRGLVEPYLTAAFRERFQDLVPSRYRQPEGAGWFPRFLATDFSRVWDPARGGFRWCSPEIQSFPANVFLKPAMLHALHPELPEWSAADLWLDESFADLDGYHRFLREHLLDCDAPTDTVIVELDPLEQKTVVDMMLTMRHLGVRLVNLRDLEVDAEGRVFYRKAWEFTETGLKELGFPEGARARRILCRALPDEIDAAAADDPRLDEAALRRLFHDTVARDTVRWTVHPQDFFVLGKATLVGHPTHEPPLRPLTETLVDDLATEGLALHDGIVKPAGGAGGRGLEGFSSRLDAARFDALLAIQAQALEAASDAAERAAVTLLWQERYRADAFDRGLIPGFTPQAAEEGDAIACELRIMWAVVPVEGAPLAPRLVPLCGLTRWSRLGDPANAGYQKTAFTGTNALLVDRRPAGSGE